MMKPTVVTSPPADWDALVSRCGGSVFHSAAWAEYRCYGGRGTPLFFRWTSDGDGRTQAVALGVLQPSSGSLVGRVASRIRFDGVPIGSVHPKACADSLRQWVGDHPSITDLRLGSFDSPGGWEGVPEAIEKRIEFILEVRPDVPLIRAMRKGTRSAISRARRLGMSVVRAERPDELRMFTSLYASTLERLERDKGISIRSENADVLAEKLGVLVKNGRACLYSARMGNHTVAGCLFGLFDGSAYYLLNGASDEGRASGATPLILLAAFEELLAAGVGRINLGGVSADATSLGSPDHGLYAFKVGLGARPVQCVGGTIIARRVRKAALDLALRMRSFA